MGILSVGHLWAVSEVIRSAGRSDVTLRPFVLPLFTSCREELFSATLRTEGSNPSHTYSGG